MKAPNDPPRLLDDAHASSALRDLLRSSKASDDPSGAQIETLAARLAPLMIAAPPVLHPAPAPAPAPAPTPPSLAPPAATVAAGATKVWLGGKVGIALVALACAGGGGAYAVHARETAASANPVASASSTPSTVAAPPAETALAAPAAAADTAAEAADASPPTRAVDPDLAASSSAAESRLATRAQQALAAHDDARALALAREHRARFPRGDHAEERDRIAIEALAHLGRGDEARAAARAFFARYTSSVYRARIESLLVTPARSGGAP